MQTPEKIFMIFYLIVVIILFIVIRRNAIKEKSKRLKRIGNDNF